MPEPGRPSGTVTFLFTDIQGSTKLWEAHPEQMRVALERHDALLREYISVGDGYVFKTIGDAFCAAFATAPAAVEAALQAQLAILSEPWPEQAPIRVRMALHTGAVECRDDDYFGPPVNRVARLLGTAHGGQTLLSQATYDLSRDFLSTSTDLRDLGTHRLRDLERPEQVFQLLHPGLSDVFPPIKSLLTHPNNLPQQVNSFVGRDTELTDLKELIAKSRLLTLTGAGGCGKTRLGLQLAAESLERFPDGAWFVELAPLTDPAHVSQAAASVLGLRQETSKSPTQVLAEHLKDRRLLLVLDNCEHLLESSSALADALLKQCPALHVLATSREALGISGEQTYRVPSLATPDLKQTPTPESLTQYDSVRLFIDRAELVSTGFHVTNQNAPALASVCHRLDGIPLAIELAAARVRSLSVEQIETRLDGRFRLLTGGSRTALPRQQTLRALIDWSYDLLTEGEKLLLSRLSVFHGGWRLDSSEFVCGSDGIEELEVLDLLTSLVDKSLVVCEDGEGSARYRLLETVRQYASDRLEERGTGDEVQALHRDCFLALVDEADLKLKGPEQGLWFRLLDEEQENLREALEWSLTHSRVSEALHFCWALWRFWDTRGLLSEGRDWCERALREDSGNPISIERAKALNTVGIIAMNQGDYVSARAFLQNSLAIFRQTNELQGTARVLNNLGIIAMNQADYPSTRTLFEESLAIWRQVEDRYSVSATLTNLGIASMEQGEYASASAYLEESLAIGKEIGDMYGVATSLGNLGNVALAQGQYSLAKTYFEQCFALSEEIGDRRGVSQALENLGSVAKNLGEFVSAQAYLHQSLTISKEIGNQKGASIAAINLGKVAIEQGDYSTAREHLEDSLTTFGEMGERMLVAVCLEAVAILDVRQGRLSHAALMWGAAVALREEIGAPLKSNELERVNREVAVAREAVGDEAFSLEFARGQGMPLEHVIALACDRKASIATSN